MSGRRRDSLLGALAWFALSYGVAILGYLVGNAVASRWLGVASYGYFVAALTASTVIGQLGLLGAHRGGLRDAARLDESDDDGLRMLRRSARATSLVTLPVAALLSAAVVAWSQHGAGRDWVLAAAFGALVYLGGGQKLWGNYLRGFGRIRVASLLEGRSGGALVAVLQGTFLALAWWLAPGTDLSGALVALVLGYALPVGAAGWMVRRHWARTPVEGALVRDIRDLVRRNWKFAVNQFAVYAAGTMEIWIAGLLLTATEASHYSAAQRLALLLAVAPTSVQVVFAPVTSRMLSRGRHKELQAVLRTGATLSAIASSLLLVPMLVAPGAILGLALGDQFRAAAPALALLTLGMVFNVLSGLAGTALTMSHHEGAVAAVQSVSVVARLVVGSAAALAFGVDGLAAAAAVITALTYTSLWWLARTRLGLRTELTLRPRLGLLRSTDG